MATNILNLEARLRFSAGNLKSEVTKTKGDLAGLRKAFNDTAKSIGTSMAANNSKNVQEIRSQIKQAIKEIDRLQASGVKNLSETTPLRRANILGSAASISKGLNKGIDAGREQREAAQAAKEHAAALALLNKQIRNTEKDMESMFYTFKKGDGTLSNFAEHAISLRYALYDISAVAGRVGGTMLDFTSQMVAAGAKQESSFTQVEKTLSGMDTAAVGQLKADLIALSQTTPVSFQDITNIAMLGSQLNVAQDQLVGFTSTVAKFSALSQMSAEDTAMGFGKIANVLGLVDAQGKISGDAMASLGSAIVAVGYNSAATEAQIISTAKQIGAVSTAAGVAATDTIALSSAFASLAIAPEEARGVTVQLFNEINKAATSIYPGLDQGSEKLRIFAEVAGMSQAEFAKAWKSKDGQNYFRTIGEGADATKVAMNGATYAFEEFISGLGKGYDVQDILKKIGLDGVRTSKGITALANGFAGLENQIELARKNGLDGTFLDKAYAKIADDINSKLQKIKNSMEALMAAGTDTSPFKDILGGLLDTVNALLIGLQKFSSTPFGSFITTGTVVVTALVGAVATLGSILLVGAGSMLAMRTALANAATSGFSFNSTLMRIIATMLGMNKAQIESIVLSQAQAQSTRAAKAALEGYTVATETATVATKGFKYAMAATGIGLVVVALASIVSGFMEMNDAADKGKVSLNDAQQAMKDASKEASTLKSELKDLFDAYTLLIDTQRGLDNALYSTGQSAKDVAGAFGVNSQAVRDYEATVSSVIDAAIERYGANTGELKFFLRNYLEFLKTNGLATGGALDKINTIMNGALQNVQEIAVDINFQPLKDGLTDVGSAAKGAAADVKTLLEVVQQALKGINNLSSLYGSLRSLGGAIEGVGKSFSSLNKDGSDALSALNASIEQIVTNANENPQKAANQLGALRKAMFQVGVTSRSAYIMIDKAIAATGKKSKVAAKDVTTYFKQLSAGLVEEMNNNARTIEDWANDIAGVIGDALDIRFRGTSAQDAITSAWNDMRDAALAAKEEIDGIKQSLDSLNADKGVLTYQLGVAIKYGDTLRANKLQADLNKINADIAKGTADLANAQSKSSTSLADGTDAAIKNRAAMLELVQKYQSYLVTIAKTTTDQKVLAGEAQKMRDDFLTQASGLGFAKTELLKYADAISIDFTKAVEEIPTNITLKVADDTPAIAALKKFAAQANVILNSIKTTITPKIGSAPINNVGVPSTYSGNGGLGGSPTGSPAPKTPTAPTAPTGPTAPTNSANIAPGNYSTYFSTFAGRYPNSSDINGSAVSDGFWIFDPANLLHSESGSAIAASRAGKPSPSAALIARYQLGKAAILAELNTQAKRSPLERMLFSGAHGAALSNIYSKYSMGSFDRAYGLGYATGGYVSGPGTGTSDSIKARLSNGEFVMRSAAVKTYGADFMNALNQMQIARPSAYAGASAGAQGGSTMVYLSSEDRALLRAAIDRPVNLYTENTRIAQSANEGNVILARRGTK